MTKRLLPAYPLFVNDPYFSVWSPSDELNGSDTIFWTGDTKKTIGLVYADGKCYCFLGVVPGAEKLEQKSVSVGTFDTTYIFGGDKFDLEVSFVSPLVLTNLRLMSRPVCYVKYKLTPKCALFEAKILLGLHQSYCYNKTTADEIIGGGFVMNGYEMSYFGLNRQLPLSHWGDSIAADWGYWYVTGQQTFFTSKEAVEKFVHSGIPEYILQGGEKYLIAVNDCLAASEGKFLVAFDELCSICYFGDWLKGYYFKDGATIFDAVQEATDNQEADFAEMRAFDKDLKKLLKDYDDDYVLLCNAAFRQSIGAHKLVEHNGELLFLSKECHSNGCIATVDITYPSMPLYLLFNPNLVEAMLKPIFKFARLPVWEFPFAPHDAGTFPYCCGQMYGVKANETINDKYISNSFRRNRQNGITVSHPMVYQWPENSHPYKFESQMPIEECANMIICCYAASECGGSAEVIGQNYDLLKKWYLYLEQCGLVPAEQLCTDDFIYRLDKHVGLSVKSIVAIKCFETIAANQKDDAYAQRAKLCAENLLKQFYASFDLTKHLPLTYDCDYQTFGMKYNMAYDVLFGLELFDEQIRQREVECYIEHNTHFGVPLDSRSDLTKTDWALYISALTDNREKQREIYHGIVNFLAESPCRVPFGDLYHVETGEIKDFQNRAVQGGIFILLLKDRLRQCQKDKKR